MGRRPSQDQRVYWSDQHLGLLVNIARKVLRLHPELDDGSESRIDELVNEGWVRALRMRNENELHGCATILFFIMLHYLKCRKYGCSIHYIPHAERCLFFSADDKWDMIDYAELNTIVDNRDEVLANRVKVYKMIETVDDQRIRTVLYMRYVCGMNNEQIAQKMHVCKGTVRSLHLKGIARIKHTCVSDT
jgi:RNA polymerase sigma factor (sigma-70 family)